MDVHNIEHIAEDEKWVGNSVEKIIGEWDVQREQFCQQMSLSQQRERPLLLQNDENFDLELEQLLSEP